MNEQPYQRKIIATADGTEIRAGWIYDGSDLAFDYYWVPVERELYVTTCTNHSGGPASPHILECFKELAGIGGSDDSQS